MKLKFETCFNTVMTLLVFTLCWSVWSGMAQTAGSNTSPAAVVARTNTATASPASPLAPETDLTPEWLEHLSDDFPVLKRKWWGNELWKYPASLVYIFLAFYISKFLDYLTRLWLRRWANRTRNQVDDLVVDLLRGPVKIDAFVMFLHIGLGFFRWPPRVEVILTRGFTIIVACSLTYMALKLSDLLLGYWRQRAQTGGAEVFDAQLFGILRKTLKAFVILVAVLVTAQNLEINVTAVITSLSIGGLAVGLAAQDTLANLFGAVAVFMDRPFRLGEHIILGTVEGDVENIGLRSTRVRTGNGYLVTIPNKTVGNASITNMSRRPAIQTEMNFGLTCDTPAPKVKLAVAILDEIFHGHPATKDLVVSFNKFGDSSLNIYVSHWLTLMDNNKYLAAMQELNLKVKERFDAEGISLAFPSRTVYVRQESGREQPVIPAKPGLGV